MLLAGNGTRTQTLLPTPRSPAGDGVHVSQPMNTTLTPVSIGPSTATDVISIVNETQTLYFSKYFKRPIA